MGRYLAVEVELDRTDFPVALLGALLTFPWFRPVTLAGIEGRDNGNHWFLSGFALEPFLERFVPKTRSAPASVAQAAAPDGSNATYLQQVAEALASRQAPHPMSPFESVREGGLTVLEPGRVLTAVELDAAARWFAEHPRASFHLYGTFALSAEAAAGEDTMVFRELDDPPGLAGSPLLLLRFAANPVVPATLDLLLMSWSTAWLSLPEAAITGDASENREKLSLLVDTMLAAESSRVRTQVLKLEGRQFREHEQELREAMPQLSTPEEHASAS